MGEGSQNKKFTQDSQKGEGKQIQNLHKIVKWERENKYKICTRLSNGRGKPKESNL
jgi:hypothetical protein